MSDPAATLALVKWLETRVAAWKAEAKSQLGLLAGERKAAVVGGQVIGHITMTKGRKTARVASEAGLLAYVKANYPSEIEVEERVRPAFLKQLLDETAKKGAFVDTDGVVIDGLIDVTVGDPYPTARLAEEADITIAALLQRGALGIDGLRQIEQ